MITGCPNYQCSQFKKIIYQVKDGFFYRKDDARSIQRYKCKICHLKYSTATTTLEYYHKKRRINRHVRANLSSGMSMRACAYNLKVSRKTIDRKLVYLAKKARLNQQKLLELWSKNPVKEIQLDEMISSIHTKLKPVSIPVVIDQRSYLVMGATLAEIPAFGKTAEISRKKYGVRKNLMPIQLKNLLTELKSSIHHEAIFKTDEHKRYPQIISGLFPRARHKTYKGMKASVVGQGELKTKGHDPLFAINHTLVL
jgi:transposase-like protein